MRSQSSGRACCLSCSHRSTWGAFMMSSCWDEDAPLRTLRVPACGGQTLPINLKSPPLTLSNSSCCHFLLESRSLNITWLNSASVFRRCSSSWNVWYQRRPPAPQKPHYVYTWGQVSGLNQVCPQRGAQDRRTNHLSAYFHLLSISVG